MGQADKVYCNFLGDIFEVEYNSLSIKKFGCPMYSKDNPDITCKEREAANCPVKITLELLLKRNSK